MVFLRLIIIYLLFHVFIVGCVPVVYKKHVEFDSKLKEIKTTGVVEPDVKLYEFSAGGVHELRDDWSEAAHDTLTKCFFNLVSDKTIKIENTKLDSAILKDLDEVNALYREVSYAIDNYAMGQFPFPNKKNNFDYSLGPLDNIFDKLNVNSLVFIYGRQEVPSSGRKTLAAAGAVVGILTGVMVTPRASITDVNIALVNRDGAVLWYGHNLKRSVDLRKPRSVKRMLKSILRYLPELKNEKS